MSGNGKSFTCHHAIAKKELKGEDVVFVIEDMRVGSVKWSLYCVCDGHGGSAAAEFVQDSLPAMLRKDLPQDPPPNHFRREDGRAWADRVCETVASVFCSLDEAFAHTCAPSGTTVSLALICGSLLTVANVGDSEVFLDSFFDVTPMTECHKVDTNPEEQDRLQRKGAMISAFLSTGTTQATTTPMRTLGPLRVWPGGIAISRSLGDFECSQHVIPSPHITQVILPDSGARLILATDGLWDHMSGKKACRLARSCILSRAPTRLFRSLMSATQNCLIDDTTILTVDIMPTDSANHDFSLFCRNEKSKKSLWSKVKRILFKMPGLRRKAVRIYTSLDTSIGFSEIKSRGHALYRLAGNRSVAVRCVESSKRQLVHRRIEFYNEETNRLSPDAMDGIVEQYSSTLNGAQNV